MCTDNFKMTITLDFKMIYSLFDDNTAAEVVKAIHLYPDYTPNCKKELWDCIENALKQKEATKQTLKEKAKSRWEKAKATSKEEGMEVMDVNRNGKTPQDIINALKAAGADVVVVDGPAGIHDPQMQKHDKEVIKAMQQDVTNVDATQGLPTVIMPTPKEETTATQEPLQEATQEPLQEATQEPYMEPVAVETLTDKIDEQVKQLETKKDTAEGKYSLAHELQHESSFNYQNTNNPYLYKPVEDAPTPEQKSVDEQWQLFDKAAWDLKESTNLTQLEQFLLKMDTWFKINGTKGLYADYQMAHHLINNRIKELKGTAEWLKN